MTLSLKPWQFANPSQVSAELKASLRKVFAEFFWMPVGRKKRLLSYLAYLNHLIFCFAKKQGLVEAIDCDRKTGARRYQINNPKSESIDLHPQDISVALDGTAKYMGDWWEGSGDSIGNIKKMRRNLRDAGLFSFEAIEFTLQKKGERKTAKVSVYEDFDLSLALLVFEAIESLYVESYGWEGLPEHKGAMMKHLYDAVFTTTLGMRRENDVDAGTADGGVLSEAEAAMERDRRSKVSKGKQWQEYLSLEATLAEMKKFVCDANEEFIEDFWELCDRFEVLQRKLFPSLDPRLQEEIPF